MRYEHRSEPLLAPRLFALRVLAHTLLAVALLAVALSIGILGYRITEGFSWLDSLLNASMILGGMGEIDGLHTRAGKLFASFYALFSGVLILAVASVLIAPVAHRLLHKMHVEESDER